MSEHKAAMNEEPMLFGADDGGGTEQETEKATRQGGVRPGAAMASPLQPDETPVQEEHGESAREANERADRLEAEMAELKALVQKLAATRELSGRTASSAASSSNRGKSAAARAKSGAAEALARAVQADHSDEGDDVRDVERGYDRGSESADGAGVGGARHDGRGTVTRTKGGVPLHQGSSSGESDARREARALVEEGNDAGSSKVPASPSSAEGEPGVGGGEAELRKDPMMAHLLDSLDEGDDIGHYGRLVFAMVARHFLPHDEVLGWLMRDEDMSDEEAQDMLLQVEQRDYSPPRRDRILQWQSEQAFPILPDVDDPDSGNVYKNLNFPKEIYKHIGHYREQKAEVNQA